MHLFCYTKQPLYCHLFLSWLKYFKRNVLLFSLDFVLKVLLEICMIFVSKFDVHLGVCIHMNDSIVVLCFLLFLSLFHSKET